jgi:putative glutamine amidotransferase
MRKYITYSTVLIVLLIAIISCENHQEKNIPTLRIAVSKAVPQKSYQHYIQWLKYGDSNIETLDMYSLGVDSALRMLESCDGLLLTGGEDIDNRRYGLEDTAHLCATPDAVRDSIEFALIRRAFEKKMPIMGICRGHQLINVYFGGTLYFDIPTEIGTDIIHRCPVADTCRHSIRIYNDSFLKSICRTKEGQVNTSHHQGVRKIAPDFIANAVSADGLIESIAYKDSDYPFLLGVQWHPERLDYQHNPLSGKISQFFLKKIRDNKR